MRTPPPPKSKQKTPSASPREPIFFFRAFNFKKSALGFFFFHQSIWAPHVSFAEKIHEIYSGNMAVLGCTWYQGYCGCFGGRGVMLCWRFFVIHWPSRGRKLPQSPFFCFSNAVSQMGGFQRGIIVPEQGKRDNALGMIDPRNFGFVSQRSPLSNLSRIPRRLFFHQT